VLTCVLRVRVANKKVATFAHSAVWAINHQGVRDDVGAIRGIVETRWEVRDAKWTGFVLLVVNAAVVDNLSVFYLVVRVAGKK